MIKKILFLFLGILFFLPGMALAGDLPEINFFYSESCPVCAKEKIFLDNLIEDHSDLKINRFNIEERKTLEIIVDFYERYKIPQDSWGLVPVTFINDKAYLGFGENVELAIVSQISGNSNNNEAGGDTNEANILDQLNELKQKEINIPFVGKFNVGAMSPMVLSVTVGILDGFNACAMVALGILLTILVSTGIRKRVIIIGGTFILVSGIVYYIFIAAWLNVFLFLGYIKIITYIIAVVIIVFALFLLKDYINGVVCKICKVDPNGKESALTRFQRYLFARANRAVSSEMPILLMVLSIAIIAAGINMIELFCSLGFPLAYTKILVEHNLPTYQYYLYLLVYVIFYMIDDFLIFLVAVFTLRVTKVSEKYLKYIKLISAIILIILGLLMLFKPELLTF